MILRALVCLLLLCGPLWAQTPATYLKAEEEISLHDRQLTRVAESLENWLAGRLTQAELQKVVGGASKECSAYRALPALVGKTVYARESKLLDQISSFAAQTAPDAEGQRRLFLALSELTESRNEQLISWRQETLRKILAGKLSRDEHNYFRWELAWLDVWNKENGLTHQLELGFLEEPGGTSDPRQILKSFLAVRALAENIACPSNLETLDATATERLTLLTRTAEQLLRLEKRSSSGALTRVRRLSRQLSEITVKFQSERLKTMARIIN
ncbi:MAG: hypothetical protein KC800_24050 [Candidatus Eremiobacteraeota bacterium]|nr:hypothetical protein [Candidatus Eremiobacteraeota bacterium]